MLMPRPKSCRAAGFAIFAVASFVLSACSSNQEGEALAMGQTMRGKVTYEGKPVPYGFVLLFSHEKSYDAKKGVFIPVSTAPIVDGKYEITNAPAGIVMIAVATDPDTDITNLLKPVQPGAHGPKGGEFKGDPAGHLDEKGPAPKVTDPKSGGSDPKKGPPSDPKHLLPGHGHFNPLTAKFSEEDKQVLRAIHAKYGEYGRSPLAYNVKEGEQTFNLVLTK
jgi:hypothetical protein